ncbi:hypothetical protein PVAP13_7NG226300 [Panicum virgatum]|uniref:Uncharacterized protein n=1 Tax=Panicum virgatum TaxID=38727 RepID=A0A8T0PX02_PANVG|nr:hypothetical protein PVAP13_7NG226300 [Panicum virgatum]
MTRAFKDKAHHIIVSSLKGSLLIVSSEKHLNLFL